MRVPRGISMKEYKSGFLQVKRTYKDSDIVVSNNNPGFYALRNALQQLPNATEFTNLFDNYRIKRVKWKLLFNRNVAQTNSNLAGQGFITDGIPVIGWVVDYDDSDTPGSEDTLLQYNDYKVTNFDKPITIYYEPRTSGLAYTGPLTNGYIENKAGQWCDTSSPAIVHYGLKLMINGAVDGDAQERNIGTVSVYCTMYCQFKNAQ